METKEKIAGVLKTALKGEEDGYRYYDLLSQKATHPDAKRKLEGLRNDEARHKATLIEIYGRVVGGDIGELPEEGLRPLAKVFEKGRLKALKSEMDYIDLAIEAELAATKHYQEQKDLYDEKDIKDIFEKMADEEHGHYELLMAERQALTGNYYWFGIDGASPLED